MEDKQDILYAIINLPPDLFYGTTIPTCLLVISKKQKPEKLKGKVLIINADAEYGEGKNQNYLRPEDTEKIVWVFDNLIEEPNYSKLVPIADIIDKNTNDTNLNIRRYVDNTPPQEPHDVKAHMVGGVPNTEILALNGLLDKYGISASDIFADREEGYSDFREAAADKAKIQMLISEHRGVVTANAKMREVFETYWQSVEAEVYKVRDGLTITDFTAKHKAAIAEAMVPVGILDKFQSLGVFANWWDHEYTVREYTDLVEDADGGRKKVDVKETITIKNVFKTICGECYVSSLVSDAKIATEHFQAELDEIEKFEAEAQDAMADLMTYALSIDIGNDEDDSDEEDVEPKEPSLKDIKKYLKDLDTDEAKAQSKEISKLEKAKNAANRALTKAKNELQDKIDAIRDTLTEEQCRTMVLQILRECFVEELNKYLLAEVMVTVKAVQKLWEKYYTSAKQLLAQRKKAEDKLNGFLEKLGYLYE